MEAAQYHFSTGYMRMPVYPVILTVVWYVELFIVAFAILWAGCMVVFLSIKLSGKTQEFNN